MVKNEVDMDIGPRSTFSGYRKEVLIGGPACPADTPTTWAADQSGRGIFQYERELTVIEFHMGNAGPVRIQEGLFSGNRESFRPGQPPGSSSFRRHRPTSILSRESVLRWLRSTFCRFSRELGPGLLPNVAPGPSDHLGAGSDSSSSLGGGGCSPSFWSRRF